MINVVPVPASAPVAAASASGAARLKAGVQPGQMLKISAMRYNPADPASVPHIQTYEIEQSDGMTLFMALMEIRERLDPSLQFDFACRAGDLRQRAE